ncbi:putative V-type ATPase [Marseillevirus Shanghai 1]|nr:putative V-type ATPase [Marseillevirus Shanghai 1]
MFSINLRLQEKTSESNMSITHNSGLSSFRARPEGNNESLRQALQQLEEQAKRSTEMLNNMVKSFERLSGEVSSLQEEIRNVKEEVFSVEKKTKTLLSSSVGFKNGIQSVNERISRLEEPSDSEKSLEKIESVLGGIVDEKFPEFEKRISEIEEALVRPVEEKPKPTRSRKKD